MLCAERLRGRRVVLFGAGRENAAFARALQGVAASVLALDEGGERQQEWWRAEVGEQALLVADPHRLLAGVPNLGPAASGSPELGSVAPGLAVPGVLAVTPGISKRHPWINLFRDAGWEITSATAEWIAATASTVIGVTGTKGKSTTSALLRHLLRAAGREVAFGGNIGIPAFTLPEAPVTVLEISSYQASYLTVPPSIAVLTSLYPEHLDWHGGVEAYYADKLRILQGARSAVVNILDATVREQTATVPSPRLVQVGAADSFRVAERSGAPWLFFAEQPFFDLSAVPLRGQHNLQNLALAAAAAHEAGLSLDELQWAGRSLGEFVTLPHRLEVVAEIAGIEFVDDLLSTIPQATVQAVAAFPDRPLTVILGGQDRGVDATPLIAALAEAPEVRAVIGLPDTGAAIIEALVGRMPVAVTADDIASAVALARQVTPPGGVVLLSPAAASYNRYRDHEDKAADFRAAISATE